MEGSLGRALTSVTLPDVLAVIPSSTYIIKTDIQGYDCRALSDERLYTSHYFIPFIYMEWSPHEPRCLQLVDVLLGHGYSPYLGKSSFHSPRLATKSFWALSGPLMGFLQPDLSRDEKNEPFLQTRMLKLRRNA